MEEKIYYDDLFKALRKVKKIENFNMSLMPRTELIDYIVEQMEKIEQNLPEAVEYIEPENTFDDDHLM